MQLRFAKKLRNGDEVEIARRFPTNGFEGQYQVGKVLGEPRYDEYRDGARVVERFVHLDVVLNDGSVVRDLSHLDVR